MSFKIYTKTGDHGNTCLGNGKKTKKTSIRIESYGVVDELNSTLGILHSALNNGPAIQEHKGSPLTSYVERIQQELFRLGSELANPDVNTHAPTSWTLLDPESIRRLESEIDSFTEELQPLKNFILPGGSLPSSHAHLARAICRRAELKILALHEQEPVREEARIYINRLSDWLFTIARFINHKLEKRDVLWSSGKVVV